MEVTAASSSATSPTLPSTAHHVRRPSRTERYEDLVKSAKDLLSAETEEGREGGDESGEGARPQTAEEWKEAVRNLLGVVDGMSIQLSTHDDLAAQLKIAQSNLTLAETHSDFLEETLRRNSLSQAKNSIVVSTSSTTISAPMTVSSSTGGKVGLGFGDTAGNWLKRKAAGTASANTSPNLSMPTTNSASMTIVAPSATSMTTPGIAPPPTRPAVLKRASSFDWSNLMGSSTKDTDADEFPSSPTVSTRNSGISSRPFSSLTSGSTSTDIPSLQKQIANLQNSLTTLHSAHTTLQLCHATLDRRCQELEKTKDDLLEELERLSIELFEEANKMVRTEREKNAHLEEEMTALRLELTRARAGSLGGESDELRRAEEELEEALGLPQSERRGSTMPNGNLSPPTSHTDSPRIGTPSFTFRGTSPNLALNPAPSPFLSTTSPSVGPPSATSPSAGLTSADMQPSTSTSSNSSRKWFSFATRPSRQVSTDDLPASVRPADGTPQPPGSAGAQPMQRIESTASSISFASISSMFGNNSATTPVGKDEHSIVFNGSRAGHGSTTTEEFAGEEEDGEQRTPGTTPAEGSPESKDDRLQATSVEDNGRPKSLPPPPTPPRQTPPQPQQVATVVGRKRMASLSSKGTGEGPSKAALETRLPPSPLDYRNGALGPQGTGTSSPSSSVTTTASARDEYFSRDHTPPALPTKSPLPSHARIPSPNLSTRSPHLGKSPSPNLSSKSPTMSAHSPSKTPSPSFLSASLFPLPPSPQEHSFIVPPSHSQGPGGGLGNQWTQLAPPADLWTPSSPSQGFYTPTMGSEDHHGAGSGQEEVVEQHPSTPPKLRSGPSSSRGGPPLVSPPLPNQSSPAGAGRRASETVRQTLEDEIAAAKRGQVNTAKWKEKMDAFSSKPPVPSSSGREGGGSRSPNAGGRRATVANVAGRSGSLSREQPLPHVSTVGRTNYAPQQPFINSDFLEELVPPGSKVSLPSSLRANMVQKEKERERERMGSYSVTVVSPKPTPPLPTSTSISSSSSSSSLSSRKLSSPSSRQAIKSPPADDRSDSPTPTPRRRIQSSPNGNLMLSPEEVEKRKSFRSKGSTAMLLGNFPKGMDLKAKESWEKLAGSLPPLPTGVPMAAPLTAASTVQVVTPQDGNRDDLEELMRSITMMNEQWGGSEDEGAAV